MASKRLNGTLDGGFRPNFRKTRSFAGTFEAGIDGNGFAADLNSACDGCTDNGSYIGGAFYGVGANGVAGLATIDLTVDGVVRQSGGAPETGNLIVGVGFTSDSVSAAISR